MFDIYALLAQEHSPLLILKKKKLNKEIVSRRLEWEKKFKMIQASKIIQKWYRKKLFLKSNSRPYFLENHNDSDLITHETVSKIPRIYLYLYQIPSGEYRGGHLGAFLDWISATPYYQLPYNPYLCCNMSENEIKELFGKTLSRIELYQSNRFLSEKYQVEINFLTNSLQKAYQSNLDRLEPIRVLNRCLPEINKLIDQLKDVFCLLTQNEKNLKHHLEWIRKKNQINDTEPIIVNDWLKYCRDEFEYTQNLLEFIPMIESVWKHAHELDIYSNLYLKELKEDGSGRLIGGEILNLEFTL
jgi:hypothetical protein